VTPVIVPPVISGDGCRGERGDQHSCPAVAPIQTHVLLPAWWRRRPARTAPARNGARSGSTGRRWGPRGVRLVPLRRPCQGPGGGTSPGWPAFPPAPTSSRVPLAARAVRGGAAHATALRRSSEEGEVPETEAFHPGNFSSQPPV